MSFSDRRQYVLVALIAFFIFICIIVSKSSDSSLFASRAANITTLKVVKPPIHRMVVYSSDENQFILFKDEAPSIRLYLDAVRDTVCGLTLRTQEQAVVPSVQAFKTALDVSKRLVGNDWPLIGITMIGQKRLINVEWAIRLAIAKNVPGDFIECGVWRGGSSIFARAVLKALEAVERHVWVADSFQGLPKARTGYDHDVWSQQTYLRVSLEEVQTNFRAFNLLDEQVHFCKGYFVDSLPVCGVTQIAVLRMDGDMYEATMDQLFNLYAKVPVGGVIIVDDYGLEPCQLAIRDFRNWHNITEEIKHIPGDQSGIYWIKRNVVQVQLDRYKPLLVSTKKYTL